MQPFFYLCCDHCFWQHREEESFAGLALSLPLGSPAPYVLLAQGY
jgi:hypothetical protein